MWTLQGAADYCRKLTRRSRSNFYYAFLFLSPERRRALDAVYSFCRLVDDAADDAASPDDARARLDRWRDAVAAIYDSAAPLPEGDDVAAVVTRLGAARERFPIRREDMEAVIEGCAWDAERDRYATWPDLEAYCYRVASAVGLMCIEIFGYTSPQARSYARDLGIALQLTNILRDVVEDGGRGRLYLPQEDLAAFGVSEEELMTGARTPAVRRLLRFEANRARGYYLRARAAISSEEKSRLVVAEIMGDIYYALLMDLERREFPAGERAALPSRTKAAIALRGFARARLQALAPGSLAS